MEMFLILILLVVIVGFSAVFWFLQRGPEKDDALILLQNQINELARAVNERLKENRESFERTSNSISKRILDFTAGITKIGESLQNVENSVKEVSSFQQIFRTPKLRGRWGELALEHILAQSFSRDMFELQYNFSSGETVDAILKLPDGKILPIDAKFPHDHFERMIEAVSEKERDEAKKLFSNEVKREIDDIAGKYILPSEGTTNVALMYIPAEAVYFEIINSFPELSDYSRAKKVLLASPNTFSLMLQVIQQWARDLQFGRQTADIIKRIQRIIIDSQKLGESFDKLGKHLSDARSSYEDSAKRLELLQERAERVVELGNEEEKLLK